MGVTSIGSSNSTIHSGGQKVSSKTNQKNSLTDEVSNQKKRHAAETQKQIETENKYAKQVKTEVAEEVDRVKQEGNTSIEAEQEKTRARLTEEKQKGYDQIRELQRKQQSELSRLKRESEHDLSQTKDYYQDTITKTASKSEQELDANQRKFHAQLELARTQNEQQKILIADDRAKMMNQTKSNTDQFMTEIQETNKLELDRMKNQGIQASQTAEERFQKNHSAQIKTQDQALGEMTQNTAQQLKKLRLDHSQKLNAYSSRASDPFYRLLDMKASLEDQGEYYELTAKIPIHEQSKVSVSIRGNQIIVSGQRKNEEKLELDPGRVRGTAVFQSFTESFPMTYPVEAKQLTKDFDGDTLIARVPKLSTSPRPETQDDILPARASVEVPNFPDNLPIQPPQKRGGLPLS